MSYKQRRFHGACCPEYENALETSWRWWNSLTDEDRLFRTKDWFGKRRVRLKPEEAEKMYAVARWLGFIPEEYCVGDIV